jgi:hypothetical protein
MIINLFTTLSKDINKNNDINIIRQLIRCPPHDMKVYDYKHTNIRNADLSIYFDYINSVSIHKHGKHVLITDNVKHNNIKYYLYKLDYIYCKTHAAEDYFSEIAQSKKIKYMGWSMTDKLNNGDFVVKSVESYYTYATLDNIIQLLQLVNDWPLEKKLNVYNRLPRDNELILDLVTSPQINFFMDSEPSESIFVQLTSERFCYELLEEASAGSIIISSNSELISRYKGQYVWNNNKDLLEILRQGVSDIELSSNLSRKLFLDNQREFLENFTRLMTKLFKSILNNPQKLLNNPQKLLNNPEKLLNNPEKLLNNPEKLLNNPEKLLNNPEKLLNNPEKLLNNPEKLLNNPEKLLNNPEKQINNPEKQISNNILDKRPLVSIITPTYNRSRFFKVATFIWNSLTYENREWIIVDDGDESIDLPKDSRIIYLKLDSRLNIGVKRNIAIENSSGDYILCMDDDDFYPANIIENRLSTLGDFDCSYSSAIACYNIYKGISFINTPPLYDPPHKRVSEATLFFKRGFWLDKGFPTQKTLGEGEEFIEDRYQKCIELDWLGSIISLIHTDNISRKTHSISEPNGNHWKNETWGLSETFIKLLEMI